MTPGHGRDYTLQHGQRTLGVTPIPFQRKEFNRRWLWLLLVLVRRCGRFIGFGEVALSRAGRRVMQPFDVVDVCHVSPHKLASAFDIVLVEFLFRRRLL